MIHVQLSTAAPKWPWARQTPGGRGEWGPFRFAIDSPAQAADAWIVFESLAEEATVVCPPERVVFISGEPSSIASYRPEFIDQFATVVSSVQSLQHPGLVRRQQAHPWFVEKSFDELLESRPMRKSGLICAIASNKSFTAGHAQRLQFLDGLKSAFGDSLDVFGRGIRDFDSKWDLLARYRYAVVLENIQEPDFLTEKLPDAWLAFCYPFYWGCSNVHRYFPAGAHDLLDLEDPDRAVALIRSVLANPGHYEAVLPAIEARRREYLHTHQFFPNAAAILQSLMSVPASPPRPVTLRPNAAFPPPRPGLLDRVAAKVRKL